MINLSGNWTLTDENNDFSVQMNIPGDAISALLQANKIDDPYYGKNEYDTRWIAQRVWSIKRTFEFTNLENEAFELNVSEVDCLAKIYINSKLVLETNNAFCEFFADIDSVLVEGINEIEIEFLSNTEQASKIQNQQPYYIPYLEFNCDIPDGNMLRKTQCDFGWDWNIALAPFGLYGNIQILKKSARVQSVLVHQVHAVDHVELQIDLEIINFTRSCEVDFEIDGKVLTHLASSAVSQFVIEIDHPKLWWPVGWGDQYLYELNINLNDVKTTKKIGLRQIKLLTNQDEIGAEFMFEVNSHKLYARGANWIPQDALHSNITQEKTRQLLQSALDANMNMIRIWGGGRYETDWFYDMCSQMGILVWQDFMFACNIYPSDQHFLDNVALEVVQQVKRLNTHSCLALWCGDNELIGALNWFDITKQHRDRYLVGYDRLNRTIEQNLKQTDQHAIWWPSSPSPGPMNFGDAWHDDRSGDMHFWDVWHSGKSFDHYRSIKPRFCSEFGFQSFPSMHIIKQFSQEKDWNIASPIMESHQKNDGGNARIAETMFRYFRFPNGFENFVYLSQIQQGLAIRTAVEYWRSIKPHCMGTLYWQLNDTWPVASWSSLNHGGSWKAMHYMVKRFYQPVAVFAIEKDGMIQFSCVNDTIISTDVTLDVSICDLKGNTKQLTQRIQTITTHTNHILLEIPVTQLAEEELIIYSFNATNGMSGQDHFSLVPYKSLDLQDSQIKMDTKIVDDCIHIELESQALALFATIECDVDVSLSDNVLMLLPGYTQTIILEVAKEHLGRAMASLRVTDLYSCCY
ncbi:beta-mannosidase [Marinicellulosiphila megalodicopiae]|uniref:beta-mannosidase n=1 Tax=Marinicellulosiphila megalodicopiae TaxID=2724896 RepID=UPI003BB03C47